MSINESIWQHTSCHVTPCKWTLLTQIYVISPSEYFSSYSLFSCSNSTPRVPRLKMTGTKETLPLYLNDVHKDRFTCFLSSLTLHLRMLRELLYVTKSVWVLSDETAVSIRIFNTRWPKHFQRMEALKDLIL